MKFASAILCASCIAIPAFASAGADTCFMQPTGPAPIVLAGLTGSVEFQNTAMALTKSVAPRVPGLQVRGSRSLIILSGGEPQAFRGTKFKPGEVGSGIATQTFTITNTGTSDLILPATPVTVFGSPNITVSAQPAELVVAAGNTVSFTLSFDRSVFGLHVATVSVHSNVAGSPFTFEVEGRAYNAGTPVTYTFVGDVPIPNASPIPVTMEYDVAELDGQICSVQVRANGSDCSVATLTGIQHTWIGDLSITLTSPAGKVMTLMDRPGVPGSTFGNPGDNLCQTVFDDNAATPMEDASAVENPFTGSYRPIDPLYEVTGDNPNGTWILKVFDNTGGDEGTVHSMSLIFRTETSPASAQDWQLFQ